MCKGNYFLSIMQIFILDFMEIISRFVYCFLYAVSQNVSGSH